MPTSGTAQDVTFAEDKVFTVHAICADLASVEIISVGNEEYIYHWQKDGKLLTRTPSQSRSLFSIAINPNNKVLHVDSALSECILMCCLGTSSSRR
jgi:hypothetical protein